MPETTIELHHPEVTGQSVVFRWTVDPPSNVYRTTSFRLVFPESVDVASIPERLWWTIFILCLHSHWILMRPCTVRVPITLADEEIDFWGRLLDTYIATAEAQKDSDQFERAIEIVCGDTPVDAIPPLEERGIVAAAFSGGKDSMVQAAILFELGLDPTLVATTSPMPGLIDHGTRYRRHAFDEIQVRRRANLVEVASDLRSAWDNAGASLNGYPFGVNEISDTFLYTAVLIAVGYAQGATHLFLASENEVSQNHEVEGRFLQHRHFMYSATTQASIRALLAPTGIYFGSLVTPLHSNQIQELLTTRYRDLRDLQFSCWRTTEERRACSECGECKRLAWVAMAFGGSPSDLGVDLVHMLNHYGDTARVSGVHQYHPNASVAERMEGQIVRALRAIPSGRVLWRIAREQPTALLRRAGWRAFHTFLEVRENANTREGASETPGYRAGYLETVDPTIRSAVSTIFDEHFQREPAELHQDQLDRQQAAIEYITAPLTAEA